MAPRRDRSIPLRRMEHVARWLLPSLLAVLLLTTAPAHAGGLPPTALDAGPEGVLDHTGEHRFTAVPLATRTVLTKSETRGGRVLRASILDGRWGVPVVADDGTSAGISADGATLALTRVARAHPRRHTAFAVVDTGSMALRHTVELDGEWRFHALSPGGRWLYLIEQPERLYADAAAIRVYDLRNDRLLRSREPVRGEPVARATGPRGRWEYTLYAGGRRSFIHALDTVLRTSLSLDLPRRVTGHGRLWALRLAIRRGKVAVLHGDRIVASAARRPRRASAGGGPPWLAVAAALTGLLIAERGTRRAQAASRRRRQPLV